MRTNLLCSLSFAIGLLAMFTVNAIAKPQPYGDNIFCWFSDVAENGQTNSVTHSPTRLSGSGGIKVNTVLTAGSKFRLGHYEVRIDGSDIVSGGIHSMNMDQCLQLSNLFLHVYRMPKCKSIKLLNPYSMPSRLFVSTSSEDFDLSHHLACILPLVVSGIFE